MLPFKKGFLVKGQIKKRGMALLLSLFLVLASPGTGELVQAQTDLERYQRELEEVSRQIELKQRQLELAKKQEKTVTGQLNVLETDIDKTETEILYLQKRLNLLDRQIAYAASDLQKAELALEERTRAFASRLKEIYLTGELQYLDVLLESSSLTEFLTRFDLLQKILEQDVELMQEIEQQRLDIATRKVELENKQLQVEQVKSENEDKQEYLRQKRQEKERTLASIQSQKAAYQKALDELEANSRELERIIRQLQPKDKKLQGSGPFIHPLPGYTRISSDYGMRYHPILKVRRMHTGVDFPAPQGTSIRAAQSGEVIFAGLMGAYGQVVVLDHGGGISTLYAHMSSIGVKVGQDVVKGDRIGAVGRTGWSTGPHLHFEVRVNGSPVNPHKYI